MATLEGRVFPFLAALLLAQTPALDEERRARTETALSSTEPLLALGSFMRALELAEHLSRADAVPALLSRAAKSARAPLVRDEARHRLLERAVRAGDFAEMERHTRALGIVPVARALGPFANVGGSAFGTALPVDGLGGAVRVPGIDRDVGWQVVKADPLGELDLVPRLTPTRETRAVLVVVIRSKLAQGAALRLGSSGQVRVTLNGAEVLKADVDRPLRFDQSSAGLALTAGDNLLVVEAGFLQADASLILRVTRPEGGALPGLEFSADAARIERAAEHAASKGPAPTVLDPFASPALREGAPERLAALAAVVALEQARESGDRRARPRALERWLDAWVRGLDDAGASPARRSGARVALASATCERDRNACRSTLEAALDLDPASVEALLALAAERDQADRQDEARALLARARAIAPTDDIVQFRVLTHERDIEQLASAIAVMRRAEAVPTERNLDLAADVAEEAHDAERALELAERARDAGRVARLRADVAWTRLASSSTRAVALAERVELARLQLALRPGSHSLASALALALVAAARLPEARALAAVRMADYPERAEPLELDARLALIAGDRDAARTSLRRATAMVPQDADLRRALRALGSDTEPLAERYGLDDATVLRLAAQPPDADAQRLGGHVAASTVAMRSFDNGLGRVFIEKLIRVHDAQKAAGLQRFSFPYSEGREEIEVLLAERIGKDGRREPALRVSDAGPGGKQDGVYTDVAEKVVSFPPLAAGDTVHLRVRKEVIGRQNLFGDFFGAVEPIAGGMPVRDWRLVIESPRARTLAWGGRGVPAPTVTDATLEGEAVRVHDFRVAAASPIDVEPQMPPWLEVADFVSVSTYTSWEALGAWYEALVAPQLALDAELKALAAELTRDAKDERDKVRRLYEYVVSSTRYVGIELGIHGWKPYPVSEVHRRKYGDCKDKASLLVALLREAGVPANLALVRTANLGDIAADPPSMLIFNHAIAYVPSLDLFLDGTAEQSGVGELPPLDQGAISLIIGAHGAHPASRQVHIPVQPAQANLNVSDYVLTLSTDGALAVRGTERFRGQANAGERRTFADEATRTEQLQRHLARVMPGAQVTRLEMGDLSLGAEELSYRFEALLPRRAVVEGNGALTLQLSLYPHDLSGSYAERSTRKTDVFVDHPWRTRNVMRYVLPPGFAATDLPSGGVVENPWVRFTQTITRTEDGFIVDEDTALLSRRIPRDKYAELRAAALAADALMKRKVRIERSARGR